MPSSKTTTKKKSTSSRSGTSSRSSSSRGTSSRNTSSRKSSSARKSSASKSRSGTQRKSTGRNGRKASARKPIRREVGALVCLLLCIFAAFGYFNIHAVFITFFCRLLKGLFGYGFWFAPPALLLASGILMFHRGRPVRGRVVCTFFLPLLFGGLLHVILAGNDFGVGQLAALWRAGLELRSGGAISGWFAVVFCKAFSRIGAAILFLLALFLCNMILTRITPADIWDGTRGAVLSAVGYFRSRPSYEEEEEEEDEYDSEDDVPVRSRRTNSEPERRIEPEEAPSRRRSRSRPSDFDIPVDDVSENPQTLAAEEEKMKGETLFDTNPRVRPPHELLEEEETTDDLFREEPAKTDVDLDALFRGTEEALGDVSDASPKAAEKPAPKEQPAAEEKQESETKAAVQKTEKTAAPSEQLIRSEAAVAAAMARAGTDGGDYQYPSVYLLDKPNSVSNAAANDELRETRELLDDTLQSFGIDARIVNVTRGPSVTRYELELMRGVKLNKLTNLAGDIALSLGASSVRIAPITGRNSVVGVEVPNRVVTPVAIREVIDSREFSSHASRVAFAVGKDISGKNIVGDIAKLPHMLIAGTTGSGKSVCTNSLIISLLYKSGPDDVRLIMVDPKMVELGIYNGIPHLLIPVVTDPKKAAGALQWAVTEMMKRYRLFSEMGVRDLKSYNKQIVKSGEKKLPQIVVVIDELADLMLVAAKEVEESICRVAQMGRAAGMHLIIATQRPSSDVITGLMKANIPSRIAFAVASAMESRIILDTTGAEKLVGKGDMLYSPLGIGKPLRVQGCMITDEEVSKVVSFIKENSSENYDNSVIQEVDSNAQKTEKGGKGASASAGSVSAESDDGDELLPSAIEVVVETGMASVSMLQRRLKLGYARAARLVDQMEERKIVGPFEGSKPRQVLITKEQWDQAKLRHTGSSDLQESDEFAAALAMSEAADAEAGLPEYPDSLADVNDDEAPF